MSGLRGAGRRVGDEGVVLFHVPLVGDVVGCVYISAGQPEGTVRILYDCCNPEEESSCLLGGPRSTLVKSQLQVASVAQWWQTESNSIRSDG